MKFLTLDLSPIYSGDKSEFSELFNQCMTQINELFELDKVLCSEQEYEEKYGVEDDFGYFQLEKLEEFQSVPEPHLIFKFDQFANSGVDSLNRMLDGYVENYKRLQILIENAVSAYIDLTAEEVTRIKANLVESLGNIATFTYYQFKLDNTLDTSNRGEELEVIPNVLDYSQSNNLDVVDLSANVKEISTTYRPKLEVFEERPELEEPFYYIAGQYISDFDLMERFLTIKDVEKLVNNENIDVEKYIKDIENRINSEYV